MRRIKEELKIKNYKIVSYLWLNDNIKEKGVIQIFHGMAEHILRYEPFIEKICLLNFESASLIVGKKFALGVINNEPFRHD